MLTSSFEYVLPAIRGIQAGREYYVSMCPVRLIPKLFPLETEEIPPEMRAQRTLNRSRVPQMARYILNNPTSYTFSAITASIDADIAFEPIGSEADTRKMGRLRVPMEARFTVNDGQHRRAALELALKENPELGHETLAIIFFLDIGLERSQQIFADLNRYAARPDSSLNILYDRRDKKADLARAVVKQVKVFRTLTDAERSNLPARSSKLFTMSGIYRATIVLLVDNKSSESKQQIELAVRYWNAVSRYIPDWEQVLQRKVSAGEIRRDYLHSGAIALEALGAIGATLLSIYPDDWEERLVGLDGIDWSRSNPDWEGRVLFGGRISKTKISLTLMTVYLKKYLNLPLTVEEEELENARVLGWREQ